MRPVNLSKNISSASNFFMHIFSMSVTYLPSIENVSELVLEVKNLSNGNFT